MRKLQGEKRKKREWKATDQGRRKRRDRSEEEAL